MTVRWSNADRYLPNTEPYAAAHLVAVGRHNLSEVLPEPGSEDDSAALHSLTPVIVSLIIDLF
jgi:hypothetical protein